MRKDLDLKTKREEAIKSMKQVDYDPYTIFINLQALGLDTKQDATDVIAYLKEKDREIREMTKAKSKTNLISLRKRTIAK